MRAVLTFHGIDEQASLLSFPARDLAALLRGLIDAQVPVCDLDTLLDDKTNSGVALSFDDGIASVFTHALPILRDYGVKAHLFLTTSVVGGTNQWPGQPSHAPCLQMLTWPQVEACHVAGIDIESHTRSHPDLRQLNANALMDECEQADEIIHQRLNRRPRYFAYPYGYSNTAVRAFARQHYRASMTTELRYLRRQEDLAAIPRLDAYYLRPSWSQQRLFGSTTRAYIGLRGLIRRLRGRQ